MAPFVLIENSDGESLIEPFAVRRVIESENEARNVERQISMSAEETADEAAHAIPFRQRP